MPTAILRTVIETQSAAAEAKLAAYGKSVNSTASKASQALSKFGVTSGQVFAAAGVAAVAFVATSVKAYAEHQRVVALLANQLKIMPQLAGATTQAFEKQATALQNLTGFTDEQVLAADTVLTRFNLTQKQIQAAIPTVLDYARAVGIDATTAATNLGKGSIGMGRALTSVGIKLTAAQKAGLTFSKTIELMKGKVEGTAEAFGETFEGKLEKLKARFNDLQEALGKEIIPALTAGADAALTFLDALNKLGGMFGGRLQAIADLTGVTNTSSAATNLLSGHFKEAGRRFLDFLNPVDSIKQALTGSSEATKEQDKQTVTLAKDLPVATQAVDRFSSSLDEKGRIVRDFTKDLFKLHNEIWKLPNNKTITVRVAGTAEATRALNTLRNAVYTIPSQITVAPRSVGHSGGAVTAAGIFHRGGPVPQFHGGGDVPAILQTGEFVMRRSAVNAWGVNTLRAMNATKASGGRATPMAVTINAGINGDATDIQRELEWWDRTRGW